MTLPTSAEEARELLGSLRDRVDDLEQRFDARANWLEKNSDRIAELEDENDELRDRVESLEELVSNLRDIGSGQTSKEAKIAALVTYADRVRADDQDRVPITPRTMAGVAGIQKRYAYDLIDELAESDTFPWAFDARDVDATLPGQENRVRALLIDFRFQHAPVQEDAEPLNKFNNAEGAGGASA